MSNHLDDISAAKVLSAVIFRDSSRSEVLVGVRKETPRSKRHPGVLSVPTMRLPSSVYDLVTADLSLVEDIRNVRRVKESSRFPVGGASYWRDVRAFAIELLFARKLGLARALLLDEVSGDAVAQAVSVDCVTDSIGTMQDELTEMVTFEVVLYRGSGCIPSYTESYSPLLWCETNTLMRAAAEHDALVVSSELNPFEVCIQGLCIQSAVAILGG